MKNTHNPEKRLDAAVEEELRAFADKIADILSPVDDIFVIEVADDVLTVMNTSKGVLSTGEKSYPLVFCAVRCADVFEKALILEGINRHLASIMPSPLETEIGALSGWYITTFGGYEGATLSTTKDHLLVKTKYAPEFAVSREDYPVLYKTYSDKAAVNELTEQVATAFVRTHEIVQENRIRDYEHELLDRK